MGKVIKWVLVAVIAAVSVAFSACEAFTNSEAFTDSFKMGVVEAGRCTFRSNWGLGPAVPHTHWGGNPNREGVWEIGTDMFWTGRSAYLNRNPGGAKTFLEDDKVYVPIQGIVQMMTMLASGEKNGGPTDSSVKWTELPAGSGTPRRFGLTISGETIILYEDGRTSKGFVFGNNASGRYDAGDPYDSTEFVEFGLKPRIVDNQIYLNALALENWLPCHFGIWYSKGEPAAHNAPNPDAPDKEYFTTGGQNLSDIPAVVQAVPVEPGKTRSFMNIAIWRDLTVQIDERTVGQYYTTLSDGLNLHNINSQSKDFYTTRRAIEIADNILLFQRPAGGFPKNVDMVSMIDSSTMAPFDPAHEVFTGGYSTMDNESTHIQLQYLARIIASGSNDQRYRAAFLRGLAFILRNQYPTGGWPQYAEPRYRSWQDYAMRITFNDDAMSSIMNMLEDIVQQEWHMKWLYKDLDMIARVKQARDMGIQCILNTQIRTTKRPELGYGPNVLTAWCMQHDPATLEPAWGRAYEPPSIGAGESGAIVVYLMRIKNPGPDIVNAIEYAYDWYIASGFQGYIQDRVNNQKATRSGSTRSLIWTGNPNDMAWGRFYEYELGLNVRYNGPGGSVYWHYDDVPPDARGSYMYINSGGTAVLQEYQNWKNRGFDSRYPLDDIKRTRD